MILSEIKRILADAGLRLSKSLGQNFLHDGNQLGRIVAAARLTPEDRVLEIGPGLGPLTELLLERAGEVLVIEIDRRLVPILERRFPGHPRLRIVHDDALKFLRQERRDWARWKAVSNLPFSVGSPLLVELARLEAPPELVVATLQLEVLERLLAGPGSRDYGVLALLVGLSYQPEGWFKVPAGCFFPVPKIDAGCIILRRRAQPLLPWSMHTTFEKTVKACFSHRRKMCLKVLREAWDAQVLSHAFAALGLRSEVRPEDVSLEQFAALAARLHQTSSPSDHGPSPS